MKKSVEEHILELRKRLLIILFLFTILSILGFYLSDIIINLLSDFFLKSVGVKLIVTNPLDYLYTKFNVAIFFGFILSIPIIIYQILVFVKPALIEKEKKIFFCTIIASALLFVLGISFSYFILLRFTLWFLANLASSAGIANLWNINYFISFIFFFCISIGLLFQLPLIIILLLKLNLVTLEDLKDKRSYVIVLFFLIAGIITPTVDPINQTIVAVPLILLYEVSLLIGRIFS
jgi:sec-independent protein translocase protein TatC